MGSITAATDYSAATIHLASTDRFLRGDIVTLLKTSNALRTGRQVARILHALDSPSFPSADWCTSPSWGKARQIDFVSLMALANEVILQRNA